MVVDSELEDEGGKDNQALDYLEKCEEFKTKLELITKAATQKNWCAWKLQKEASALDPDHLKRLSKSGDYKALVKTIGEKVDNLKGMQSELKDLEAHQVEAFGKRLKDLVAELSTEQVKCDKLLESCGFLHRSMGEQKRTVSLADSYQKRKWSGELIKAGWDKECAAAAIAAMIDSDPVMMYGVEGELKWVAAMMFDDTEGYGKDIYGAINELQLKCGQEVDGKKTSVIDFLKENESKTGALVKILGGDQVPQLKNRITGLPEEGAQWHHDAGSAPWLIAAKIASLAFWPMWHASRCHRLLRAALCRKSSNDLPADSWRAS